MAQDAIGSFALGFDIKGFDENNMGADVISTFKSKETWVEGEDGEKDITQPIQVDLTADRELKVAEDGEMPDGYLFRKVTDADLTVERFVNQIPVDEVKAGESVDYIRHRKGAFLQTSLLDGTDTPTKGDDVYIAGGLFANADPGTEGEVIGEVVDDETGDEKEGYVLIKLA
ncbi:MAG: hypothetical protein ACQEQF_01785 [Bacillota bacterium]